MLRCEDAVEGVKAFGLIDAIACTVYTLNTRYNQKIGVVEKKSACLFVPCEVEVSIVA